MSSISNIKFTRKAIFATFIYNLQLNCLWKGERGDDLSHEVVYADILAF